MSDFDFRGYYDQSYPPDIYGGGGGTGPGGPSYGPIKLDPAPPQTTQGTLAGAESGIGYMRFADAAPTDAPPSGSDVFTGVGEPVALGGAGNLAIAFMYGDSPVPDPSTGTPAGKPDTIFGVTQQAWRAWSDTLVIVSNSAPDLAPFVVLGFPTWADLYAKRVNTGHETRWYDAKANVLYTAQPSGGNVEWQPRTTTHDGVIPAGVSTRFTLPAPTAPPPAPPALTPDSSWNMTRITEWLKANGVTLTPGGKALSTLTKAELLELVEDVISE